MQNVRLLEDLLSRGAQRAKTILLLISTDKKHNAKHGLYIYYSLDRILTAGYKQGTVAVIYKVRLLVYPWNN
jgi:hypothetical protein